MSKQPNILYVFTDQQTALAMSCAGNSDVSTPHMDSLARRGVRFTRAYCTHPLCTPSRMSMWSGRMPAQMGITGNAGSIPEGLRRQELGHVLRSAGYTTAYGGKWHAGGGIRLSADVAEEHGFQVIADFDDIALPDACDSFLARTHDKPFCLVASFDNPHNICEHGRDQLLPWGEVADAPIADYPNLPVNSEPAPYEPEVIDIQRRSTAKINRDPAYTRDRWRKYRHAYYRLVELVDERIGRIFASLDRSGHGQNTLIILTSDHGEMAGAHRLGHKQVHYEESIRVPLIVAGPGVRQGVTDDRLVSNGLDLLPTLCDYANTDLPQGLVGRSWRPLLEGEPVDWRDHLVIESVFGGSGIGSAGANGRIVLDERHKYVCYDWGQYREQLYDLTTDAGEMVNLAIESRHAATLQLSRERLRDWCVSQGDRFAPHYGRLGCAGIPGIGLVPTDRPPSFS